MTTAADRITTSLFSRSLLGDLDVSIMDALKPAQMISDMIFEERSHNGKKAIEILNYPEDPYAYGRDESTDLEYYTQEEGPLTLSYVQFYTLNKILSQEVLEFLRSEGLKSFLKSGMGKSTVKSMTGMAMAHKQTMNKVAMQMLSNYDSSSQLYGDGQPLASTSQPLISGGTFSNIRNYAPPTPEVVQNVFTDQASWQMHGGRKTNVRPRMIIGHPSDTFAFEQIITATGSLGNDFNNRNIIGVKQGKYLPDGFEVDAEYTDDGSWIVINDLPEGCGLMRFIHKQFESRMVPDVHTFDTLLQSQAAYSHSIGLKHALHVIAGV